MENKKKSGWPKKIFIALLITFLCLYSISIMGYQNRENEYKSLYTKDMIEKFESDVESGKNIDINDYINYEKIDYSNKASKMGVKISEGIDFVANKSFEMLASLFNYLFQ